MMKMFIRNAVRWILKIREDETIQDGIKRIKSKFFKKFYKQQYGIEDLKDAFIKAGIKPGSNVIVHSAYREFYNFRGTPEDVINLLKELVSEEGTILMPSYGENMKYFNVNNDISKAGVISEYFRQSEGVIRSECSNFSIAAYGKKAIEFTKEHSKSHYGFDEYSPYYLLANEGNGKIVMLGMGKYPVKNTVFHFAGYLLRNEVPIFNNLLCEEYDAVVVNSQGKKAFHKMVTRGSKYKNSSWKMKKMFKMIPVAHRQYIKLSNLDIVVYDAKAALDTAITAAKNGFSIYKNIK